MVGGKRPADGAKAAPRSPSPLPAPRVARLTEAAPPAVLLTNERSESRSPSPMRRAEPPRSPPRSLSHERWAVEEKAAAAAAEARQQLRAAAAREKALQREVLMYQSKAAAAEADEREERMLRERAEALRDDALAFAKETERRALEALQATWCPAEPKSESAPERWEREAAAVVVSARGGELPDPQPEHAGYSEHLGAHAAATELWPPLKRIVTFE